MVRALFMKDIRLIRKNFAVMAVMIIGMPIFLFWRVDTKMDAGGVPLLLMSSILGLILFGNICTEEENVPVVRSRCCVRPVPGKCWWL